MAFGIIGTTGTGTLRASCPSPHLLLFSEANDGAVHHLQEFFGSPVAEVSACEPLVESRAVEGWIERSVGLALDVDVDAFIYVRVTLQGLVPLLVGGILDEEEVVLIIACDGSVDIVADGESSWLPCEELEVDARLGVRIYRLMVAVAASEG